MTFNDNSNISSGKVSHRGRNGGIAAGGGLGAILLYFVLSQLGVNVGDLGGDPSQAGDQGTALENCQTGRDANEDVNCRMKGAAASLDAYWAEELPALGGTYQSPQDISLFDGSTNTGCGAATSATGPFYCPPDQTIFIDTAFFDDLRTRFGSSGGSLAQMYVVAHEWGHHIQNITGILDKAQDGQTGAESNSVRTELQADCFAGSWAAAASDTKDSSGVSFLKEITPEQIRDALSAAAAVGDDRIQASTGGRVDPEGWTHGSSEQRQHWFMAGFEGGAAQCDTFAADIGTM